MTEQQNKLTKIENPYGEVAPQQTGALANSNAQREIQEVQAAMVIAKQFPRDEKAAMDRILNACTRPKLAENAVYSYAKGGTSIEGPSIRLAEAIAQAWGNLQFGMREVEQSEGSSTVEAFAWDIETNTRQVKVFQVSHERHTKRGSYKLTDPREIYETVANQGARRLRACVLGIIPGDVVEAAVNQCSATMQANEKITDESIKNMLAAFEDYNVGKGQIEKRIQRRMDSITPALMAQLRKIYTSMKDGMSGASDWFDVPDNQDAAKQEADQSAKDKLRSKLADQRRESEEQAKADNSPERPAENADTPDDKPLPNASMIAAKLGTTQTGLRKYCGVIGMIPEKGGSLAGLTAEDKRELVDNADKHKSALADMEDND